MKNILLLSFVLSFSCNIFTQQQQPSHQDQFIIGAYMQSTPWAWEPGYFPADSALLSIWRAKAIGINTAMVYVQRTDPDGHPIIYTGTAQIYPNMDVLEDFPNVIAMNTRGSYRALTGDPTNYIRNFDYIRFYTGAYYSNWDATLDVVPVGKLGLKHGHGHVVYKNGKKYWSTGISIPDNEAFLVKGPHYLQETRYRSSTNLDPWDNDIQTYYVNFGLDLMDTPNPWELNGLKAFLQ
jgi:hypothetical protein